jgi:hypothetical protein
MIFGSGYMSPAYAMHEQYSIKSYIFSFEILVLEILSGKKNKGFCHPDCHPNLLLHVSSKVGHILLIYFLFFWETYVVTDNKEGLMMPYN